MLARQFFLVRILTAVSADVAVAREQLAVGQAWLEVEGVDVRNALGADDAADSDDRLLARDGVVAAAKACHLRAHLPPHFLGGVMQNGLLQ